jgi:hypothetical protein
MPRKPKKTVNDVQKVANKGKQKKTGHVPTIGGSKVPTAKVRREILEVKQILDKEKVLLESIKDAKVRALSLLTQGYDIPGYGTEKNLGNRTWKKAATPDKIYSLISKWVKNKSTLLTKPVLLSPAKVSAYVKEVPEAMAALDKFIEREDKGEKLVSVKTEV